MFAETKRNQNLLSISLSQVFSLHAFPAVVYEMLYRDVFKLSRQVDEAVDILRCSGKKPMRRDFSEGMRGDGMDGGHMGMLWNGQQM